MPEIVPAQKTKQPQEKQLMQDSMTKPPTVLTPAPAPIPSVVKKVPVKSSGGSDELSWEQLQSKANRLLHSLCVVGMISDGDKIITQSGRIQIDRRSQIHLPMDDRRCTVAYTGRTVATWKRSRNA